MMPHMYATVQCPSVNRDQLHAIIKNFREAFPDNFAMCGLVVCDSCEGSGLPIPPSKPGAITAWADGKYCNKCKGFGVTNIKKIYSDYLCKQCKGEGCKSCDFKGAVDWISNAVTRVIK